MWKNLVYSNDECLYEGTVFRFPTTNNGGGYFEFIMEYLLRRTLDNESPLEFIEYSGSHTGHKVVSLTMQMLQDRNSYSKREFVKREWLIENWNKYIYAYCNVEDVYYKTNIPAPKKLPILKKYEKYEL
jgi:hypothetical protein